MTGSQRIGNGGTRILAPVIAILGVAIIVRTVAAGGGALSIGVLLGVVFLAIGAGRLYLAQRTSS
jgi:hypothetical protein